MSLNPAFSPDLLSRIEDAGLNASAPPQQRWYDGWIVRLSPGKAKRARCINAVSPGRLDVASKLAACEAAYRAAQLPLVFRVTPFTQPSSLDAELAARGLSAFDDTRVMVCTALDSVSVPALSAGHRIERVGHALFAQLVGQWRGSPLAQWQAHAQRLELSPVPFRGVVLKGADGTAIACAQSAAEGDLVGLYDVFTRADQRGRGFARLVCAHLLAWAHQDEARVAYLQVDSDNLAARRTYQRLGFADAYAYHYRAADPHAP